LLCDTGMERHSPSDSGRTLLGLDGGLRAVGSLLDSIAAATSTVLILGETGTGKELLAREIHARSARAHRPLIAVNCAAFCEGLLESELFGHERGAFTGAERTRLGRFEAADGGTLFLDEVGELPIRAQVALLRVLEERKFERVGSSASRTIDVRVIAATNANLADRVRERTFREDLYYRLGVVLIALPPLRERLEDIPVLATAFVEEFGRRLGKSVEISAEAVAALQGNDWPGNVRELRNLLERAVLLAKPGTRISPAEVVVLGAVADGCCVSMPVVGEIRARARQEQRKVILEALHAAGGNIAGAARRLGVPRTTLHDSIRRLKLG
jgi:transcriptional regulator with GAF, ATPase, and Fis domain